MNVNRIAAVIACSALAWVMGCEVSDPGSPHPNQPPTTTIASAPQNGDTVNHYLELRWSGNDADGYVTGFEIWIDDALVGVTTSTDTTMAFAAPTDNTPLAHKFSVVAIDDDGARDLDPDFRQFYVTNVAPTAAFGGGSVPVGQTVGHGFRIEIEGTDGNLSLLSYSISLGDDQSWSEWSENSTFYVTDLSLWTDDPDDLDQDSTIMLAPTGVTLVSNAGLSAGGLTIFARVKDAGEAVSETVSRAVTVADGFRPAMDPTVSGVYGSEDFYLDGSVYRINNTETQISFAASVAAYYGTLHSYQYEYVGDGDTLLWSRAVAVPALVFDDLAAGEYPFRFTARDIAGAHADTIDFTIRIVQQQLRSRIVMIDETRDGNGNPGSPTDDEVDEFYASLLAGQPEDSVTIIDYSDRPGGVSYVSPYDLGRAGLVVWHSDDFADRQLPNNTRLLEDYLDRGGRLILSGWDLIGAFTDGQVDSVEFNPGSFAYEKLRIFDARYNSQRTTTGIIGVNGFPDVAIDPDKLPSSFGGAVNRTWGFTQRGECIVTGTMNVGEPSEDPFYGETVAYYYNQSFRVAVFGLPLYFCKQAEAEAYFDALLERMMTGLGG